MRVVICAREVLDPDAVNNYALAGRLVIGEDGKTLTQTTIPRLMNAYDEQAIEAALRLRDAGVSCTITVVSAGADPVAILRHAAAMGADQIAAVPVDPTTLDGHATGHLLAAFIRHTGGADLVLCGRQASDDDQGAVPGILAEALGMPVVTVARAVALAGTPDAPAVRVTRVTPDGDELVEVVLPAVVTVSSELGQPRYPTTARKMAVRRTQPETYAPGTLPLAPDDLAPRVRLVRQFVPTVQGQCEMIAGASAGEMADTLVARLRGEGVIA